MVGIGCFHSIQLQSTIVPMPKSHTRDYKDLGLAPANMLTHHNGGLGALFRH